MSANRRILVFLATLAASMLTAGGRGPLGAQPLPTEGYQLVATWKSTAPSGGVPTFGRALAIDVAEDDTVYVVDSRNNTVHHLKPGGEAIGSWTVNGVGSLLDLAVSTDRVYVLGQTGGAIHRRDGTLVRAWAARGAGVAFGPDRRVYVARLAGTSTFIDVYDVDGNQLEQWRDPNIATLSVFAVDVGPDGRVYVVADGAIYVYRSNGAGNGTASGLLRVRRAIEGITLSDVAVDAAGRVYAASPSGYLVVWSGAGPPTDVAFVNPLRLAVGPGAGLVVTTDAADFKGIVYLPDRVNLDPKAGVPWGAKSDVLGKMLTPRRVAGGAGADVVFLDRQPAVQRWSSAGQPLDLWPTSDFAADVAGGAPRPCIITGRAIRCFDVPPADDWIVEIPATGWLTAVDGDATGIAALDLADQKVWLYGRDHVLRDSWPLQLAPGDTTFFTISDVALAGNRVYLADPSAGHVDIRNLDGTRADVLPVPAGPVRVAVAGGAVYVLGRDERVWKYGLADKQLRAVWETSSDGTANDLAADAAGRVYVADAKNDRILVFQPGGAPPTDVPVPPSTKCNITTDKRAAPDRVEIGQPVTVQLVVRGACPLGDGRLDVVLVIDQSGSMMGTAMPAAQAAALSFLNELRPGAAQVSVVGFATTAEVLQPLTSDLRQIVRAVSRLTPQGQTNYIDALDRAREQYLGPAARPGVPRVVVMMTDGKPTNRLGVDKAAQDLKDTGATLYTIGFGSTIDADLLRSMATTPDLYFDAPTEAELGDVYREIARRITGVRLLQQATVVDRLPADMRYESGSSLPPATYDAAARTLTWRLTEVPATGRTMSFRVRPAQAGRRPTNVAATMTYVDATGAPGEAGFPVPEVTVTRRSIWNAHLPLLYKNRCQPQRADVVLVMDTSSSMLEPERAGSATNKLQAAVASARSFLEVTELPEDKVSIVAFDSAARVVEPLTGSRAALGFALSGLSTGVGTRIDLGLQRATAELLTARHQRNHAPVIILLTDGRPSGGSEGGALAAGRDARGLGFAVYTIGFGADADMGVLSLIAGRHDRTFFAPSAGALTQIYQQIAGKVLCEP
ncbi:hypothetical protein DCC79_06210 [bacterium]|nr:VWA domain-containing protein [Chloroflexi bacterium CFX6]RIL11008.1 MAG: hypothetical protein DCC79_06210 [bacterium]